MGIAAQVLSAKELLDEISNKDILAAVNRRCPGTAGTRGGQQSGRAANRPRFRNIVGIIPRSIERVLGSPFC
jgi:hypothetical protein